MTSAAALRVLCGKPGAAKQALLELDATNVHGGAAAAATALGDGVPGDDEEISGSGDDAVGHDEVWRQTRHAHFIGLLFGVF